MLQFIVLGLIPGTTIQINFGDVLQIGLAIVMLLLVAKELRRFRAHAKSHGKLFSFHKQV